MRFHPLFDRYDDHHQDDGPDHDEDADDDYEGTWAASRDFPAVQTSGPKKETRRLGSSQASHMFRSYVRFPIVKSKKKVRVNKVRKK